LTKNRTPLVAGAQAWAKKVTEVDMSLQFDPRSS